MNEQSILDFIPIGEENAVHSSEICERFNLTSRERRKLFEHLRNAGGVICSCDNGFFKPATPAELSSYIKREKARSRSISFSLRSARKLLKDWDGES
ncbi:MAG: hypothetical protein J5582_15565 [Ruminococcus sp.]|uniref:hypothetical protein n=1 Tax=Ruminococcus sp. TaxID=41978 RepID=UPI0025E17615|nr:hypothetical protein [Ruminococcus sp.]MBO4867958.1 hypothetical protein [Ruminococcus sp.]